jgi:hypothetical protein
VVPDPALVGRIISSPSEEVIIKLEMWNECFSSGDGEEYKKL